HGLGEIGRIAADDLRLGDYRIDAAELPGAVDIAEHKLKRTEQAREVCGWVSIKSSIARDFWASCSVAWSSAVRTSMRVLSVLRSGPVNPPPPCTEWPCRPLTMPPIDWKIACIRAARS